VILGCVAILVLYVCGFRRCGDGIPIASSCSAAVSAAFHCAGSEDANVVETPLKYGALAERNDGVKRVGSSAGEVGPLGKGVVYT